MDDGLEVMDDGEDFSSDHDPIFYNQSLVRKRPKKFDDVWDKLKIVENFVSIKYQSKIACIFMYEKSGRPFLKVSCTKRINLALGLGSLHGMFRIIADQWSVCRRFPCGFESLERQRVCEHRSANICQTFDSQPTCYFRNSRRI